MTDRLHRLHRALVDELDRRGHQPDQPLKVAEIYEDLVPYRTARSVLDVHVRGDYEHILLRLLAGEDSLVRLQPDEARDELRREVDKPYPDVALYRKFAASDVVVGPPAAVPSDPRSTADASEAVEETRDDQETRDAPVPGDPAIRREPDGAGPDSAVERPDDPAGTEPAGEEAEVPEENEVPEEDCIFCGRTLPADRPTRFCPLCGGDQRLEPCDRCGEPLEPTWRFCIACGQEARDG